MVTIIHVAVLILCVLPSMFLDLGMGQYSGKGPLRAMKVASPFFRGTVIGPKKVLESRGWNDARRLLCFPGLGFACCLLTWVVSLFNGIYFSWNLLYLFASFTDELPWGVCDQKAGSHSESLPGTQLDEPGSFSVLFFILIIADCYSERNEAICRLFDSTYYNLTCIPYRDFCEKSNFDNDFGLPQGHARYRLSYNDTQGFCLLQESAAGIVNLHHTYRRLMDSGTSRDSRLVSVVHVKRRIVAAEDFFQ